MRNQKKMMKERFRKEVGDDYKLFFLSGLQYDLFREAEINNLARYISVIKIKDETWRDNQSFLITDRWDNMEDGKKEIEDECDVAFYGYIRGTSLRETSKVLFNFIIKDAYIRLRGFQY